jgi:methionyl-tRNA synthetase
VYTQTANCIGYAAFCATTCNELFQKNSLSGVWIARPQIGQLHLFGTNIHPYFHSAFFKDHDFVVIENKQSGMVYAVDPTVHDYLGIEFVRFLH